MFRDRFAAFTSLEGLVERRAPTLRDRVHLRRSPAGPGMPEHVTVSASEGELTIDATSTSSAAVGLAHALEHLAGADLSWDAAELIEIPSKLPDLAPRRLETALPIRYHLNPVAFGYTMAFWGWERWERYIDWMALHGVTHPLNLVGHDAVLVRMLCDLGMDRDRAARFVGGPAFLPWTTMGITHDIGAALSDEVLEARAQLGRRIADRERELGMTVVLPGFGGQLPAELAGTQRIIDWQGWQNSIADPNSSLFAEAAASLHRHQLELFGTDHHYAVDPYIESLPPAASLDQLAEHAWAIFSAMHRADSQAVWILQGWPFHYRASYWTDERVRSLLSRIPEDRLILLDLWGEHAPMWERTASMYGRRWLWCLTHTFGGRFGLFGDLHGLGEDLEQLRAAAADGTRGQLEGFGITSEALDDNGVVYELAARALWSPMPPVDEWLQDYAMRRYGASAPEISETWRLLSETVYGPGRTRATPSPLIARPWSRSLPFASQRLAGEALPDVDGAPSANVDAENDLAMLDALAPLARAVRALLPQLGAPKRRDALGHDLAQLAIHVGAQSARAPLRAIHAAVLDGDSERIRLEAKTLEALIRAVDSVAATRPELLVGHWIAEARSQAGEDPVLADALERDARSLISVWGEQDSGLHDYSARHWSGSLTDLHLQRWKLWAVWLAEGTAAGNAATARFRSQLQDIEEAWRNATDPYPETPRGDLQTEICHLLDLAEQQLPRLTSR